LTRIDRYAIKGGGEGEITKKIKIKLVSGGALGRKNAKAEI